MNFKKRIHEWRSEDYKKMNIYNAEVHKVDRMLQRKLKLSCSAGKGYTCVSPLH